MEAVRPVLVCLVAAGCASEAMFAHQVQIDTFEQTPNDAVDILFVVDDSHSMIEEQQALADGFSAFVGELESANARFQLGVISTSQDSDDPLRGHLIGDPPYLTREDDYLAAFRERVMIGVEGSSKEKGLEGAALAVSPDLRSGPNAGFLRSDAHLLVVFVSDEEDCSDGGALDGREPEACYTDAEVLLPVPALVELLWDAKGGDREKVSIGAIIGPAVEGACETAYPGHRYAHAVHLAGGLIGDVCQADWSTMLYDLGLNASGVLTEFELTHGAIPETLTVEVDGVLVPQDPVDGWTYEPAGSLLRFHGAAVPPRGAQIVVEYQILPGG